MDGEDEGSYNHTKLAYYQDDMQLNVGWLGPSSSAFSSSSGFLFVLFACAALVAACSFCLAFAACSLCLAAAVASCLDSAAAASVPSLVE